MIIRDSLFIPDPWGHGGCKRTAQISEILRDNLIDAVFLNEIVSLKDPGKIRALLNSIVFLNKFPLRVKPALSLLYKYGREYSYSNFFKSLDTPSVILWENNHSFRSNIPFLARQVGLPVIAIPHNLESLVPTQKSFLTNRISPQWFDEELSCLACCDRVFVISREEQWLLRLHGIAAEFLPYFPPLTLAHLFSQIRAAREGTTEKKGLLMLGSASNPPTMQGMADRIRFFKKHCDLNVILHVAGSDTEKLKGEAGSAANIIIHGKIEQETLRQLLIQIKAVIVHQFPTSGALTRIPEMICAGVPVIADINSSRTWSGMNGLYTYEDDEEFKLLLNSQFPVPPIPPKPASHERRFVAAVRNYVAPQ